MTRDASHVSALARSSCQYVLGGSDDSTYLNAAVHLSRSGALFFEDPVLQGLPLEIRQVTWDQYLPGFYFVEPEERGSIVSHGFHFYTAFLAVLRAIGGLPLLLEGSSVLAGWTICRRARRTEDRTGIRGRLALIRPVRRFVRR